MRGPEDVFTPRSAEVNPDMYMPRQWLEDSLSSALRRSTNIIIHGESGSGKSWLYKKVFADLGVSFIVGNLANASRLGSISAELQNLYNREQGATKTGYSETKAAELGVIAKGALAHTGNYAIPAKEPFEACLAYLRSLAGSRKAVLVLDNLEAMNSAKGLKELADIIVLCDDLRYSSYRVQLLLVGVPLGLREYYYRTPHLATVANRLYEVPEVARLPLSQCHEFVKRGFGLLSMEIADPTGVSKHIASVTDRIPQRLHEYCLELALVAELFSRRVDLSLLRLADVKWLRQSLYEAYSVVESHMNDRGSRAGRRNQALYALSRITTDEFKAATVEQQLRTQFPESTSGVGLNMPNMLRRLSTGKHPILKRTPKGDAYELLDPRYRMAMRAMLKRGDDETVELVDLAGLATSPRTPERR